MQHLFLQKKCSFFSFMVALLLGLPLSAQFDLTGQVWDATTKAPLAFANVFIASSSIGVYTQEDGTFVLKNVPEGNQALVVSFLGYESLVKRINVNKQAANFLIEVKLKPTAIDLVEVEVKSLSQKKRKKYLKRFTQAFLGMTKNKAQCKIVNPEVIDFKKEGKKIIAAAQELIEIENRALGYRLFFYLEKFEIVRDQVTYGGKPLFQALTPADAKEQKKWVENRWETYQGSPRHFYEALLADELQKEGFEIYLAQLKNGKTFTDIKAISAPVIVQENSNPQIKSLKIDDFLKVVFVKETEQNTLNNLGSTIGSLGQSAERDMIQQTKGDFSNAASHPTSYLFARKSNMKISIEGRLLQPELMLTYGDWAAEGVADLLPFDYIPRAVIETAKEEIQATDPSKKGFILSNLLIPLAAIKDGGPPRDGIPSIDRPRFLPAQAVNFLAEEEQVLAIHFNGISKAYPIKILDHHEIVNDLFGTIPVAVTFCPLCASGIGFKANINGQKRSFGVSGLLYNSDVLLYDRETESLWSQIMGKAVSGKASGQTLELIPTEFTTWGAWKKRHPNSLVLSTKTGFQKNYERQLYASYFKSQKLMFSVSQKSKVLKNKDKVIGLAINGKFKAYPFKRIRKMETPFQDELNGKKVFIFYDKKSNSARIENEQGEVIEAISMFWFAWYAFHPETEVFKK